MSEIPPPSDVPPTTPPSDMGDPTDVEKNKIMAILAYIGIFVLVPILAAKESPFAKYHANQGILLTGGGIAIYFVLVVIFIIAHFVPFLGIVVTCFSCFLFPLMSLGWLALVIIGILNAVNGKMRPLPGFPNITLIK